jgi:hypothetical protein
MYRIAPLVLILLGIAYGMAVSWPIYDDSLLEILVAEKGPQALVEAHGDRPVYGEVAAFLAERDLLWVGFGTANLLQWFVLALTTGWLFEYLFPGERRLGVAASLVAIAPILIETQYVIPCGFMSPVALGHLCTVLLLRSYRTQRGYALALAVTFGFTVLDCVFSEYGVATAGAVAAIVGCRALFNDNPAARRRDWLALATLVLATGVGYAWFLSLTDPTFRPGTGPFFVVSEGVLRFVKAPFRLLSAIGTIAFGAVSNEIGSVHVNTYQALAGVGGGIVVAACALLAARRTVLGEPHGRLSAGPVLVLLATIVVGLTPVVLMGRRMNDFDPLARFFLPVLPASACLMTWVVAWVAQRFSRSAVVALLAFLAGYTTYEKAFVGRVDRKLARAWGHAIEAQLDPNGLTVAVFPRTSPPMRWAMADDELTSRLGQDWPIEKRVKFWATPDFEYLRPGPSSAMRGAKREGPITRLLIAVPRGDRLRIVAVAPDAFSRTTTVSTEAQSSTQTGDSGNPGDADIPLDGSAGGVGGS